MARVWMELTTYYEYEILGIVADIVGGISTNVPMLIVIRAIVWIKSQAIDANVTQALEESIAILTLMNVWALTVIMGYVWMAIIHTLVDVIRALVGDTLS